MSMMLRRGRRQHGEFAGLLIVMMLAGSNAICQIAAFPFSESFDVVVPPTLPVGWSSSQKRSAGANDFATTASTPNSPPHAVGATNSMVAQWLQSPILDMSSVTPDSLVFWIRRSSSFAASMVVEASADAGMTFDFSIGDTIHSGSPSGYERVTRALPALLGGKRHIILRWRTIPAATGSTGTIRIDDVRLSVRALVDLAILRSMVVPLPALSGDSLALHITVMNRGTRTVSHATLTAYATLTVGPGEATEERTFTQEYSGALVADDSALVVMPLGPLHVGEWTTHISINLPGDQDTSNNSMIIPLSVGVRTGSLVVNEIQFSPPSGEPEWIEVINTTPESFNLYGWTFSDAQVDVRKPVSPGHLWLGPAGMVVLTGDSLAIRLRYPSVPSPVLQVPSFPSLNNSGDAVVLFDGGGRIIDSVRYSPTWGGGTGMTLERIDSQRPSNSGSNWSSCFDSRGGTPGEVNSVAVKEVDLQCSGLSPGRTNSGNANHVVVMVRNVGRRLVDVFRVLLFDDIDGDSLGAPQEELAICEVDLPVGPGDSIAVPCSSVALLEGLHQLVARVVAEGDLRERNNDCVGRVVVPLSQGALRVNEIMYDPLDGDAEYVELINASGQTVDLWSCVIHDRAMDGGTTKGFVLAGHSRRLDPDQVFVLSSDSTILLRFKDIGALDRRFIVLARQSSLGLNNDGDVVYVCGPDSAVVDSVAFLPSWHNPDLGSASGRSLEKIAPRFQSNEAQNWATCAHPLGGTPGRQNSVYAVSVPTGSTLSFAPNPFSPDDDGQDDVVVIRYVIPVSSSIIRVRIFDVVGREIRTLSNGSPAGAEGELVWDGRNDDRRKVRFGMYIVLFEASGMGEGRSMQAKGVVVVGGRL